MFNSCDTFQVRIKHSNVVVETHFIQNLVANKIKILCSEIMINKLIFTVHSL
jgi:hypothetical protein